MLKILLGILDFLGNLILPIVPYVAAFLKVFVVLHIILIGVAILTWAERKIIGRMQVRHGPMRVGWHGLLQVVADAIKLQGKEFIWPVGADKPVFLIAPIVALIFGILPIVALPWGPPPHYVIADINVGLVYILGLGSLDVYGIIMGGWASNSKYALLGALRSIAQTISYEIPLIMSVIGSLMLAKSFSLVTMANAQYQQGVWYMFIQPVGFVILIIAGMAEAQRVPFDMLEDDGSLVAGFFTEYGGMAFAIFSLAEYAVVIIIGGVAAYCFMGGWYRPFPNVAWLSFLDIIPPMLWFTFKIMLYIFLAIWFRTTFPRVRYDQLMYLGWKVLLPLSLVNLLMVGIYVMFDLTGFKIIIYYALMVPAMLYTMRLCSKYFYGTLNEFGYEDKITAPDINWRAVKNH
ncbi:MAG: NADH-quinone oxidoreductase subunit NuoH [bacterium]